MLRRDLGVDVTLEAGPYGSFEVRVDDELVVDGGALSFLGVLPTLAEIRARWKHVAIARSRPTVVRRLLEPNQQPQCCWAQAPGVSR
jgi:hypothetical protein